MTLDLVLEVAGRTEDHMVRRITQEFRTMASGVMMRWWVSEVNVSAIRYRLDSFKDLSNKVVYLFYKYLNYTKEAL